MIQKFTALELKPHLWNNDDLWKKIWHFKHWKSLHSYHVAPILAFKSSSQYGYLEGFKWPVLWNLSLIYELMMICEKKLNTLSIESISYHVVPIFAVKSRSQYRYLEGFKWPMLWNLSLIFIIMRIHEKILDTLSTGIVCIATILKNCNGVAIQRFPVLKVSNIFSWILIIMNMRLKFQSTGHLKPSKYLYWELLFNAKIGTTW